jgi:hypothetical protein
VPLAGAQPLSPLCGPTHLARSPAMTRALSASVPGVVRPGTEGPPLSSPSPLTLRGMLKMWQCRGWRCAALQLGGMRCIATDASGCMCVNLC